MRGLKLLTLLGCGAALWGTSSAVVYGQGNASKGAPPAAPPTFSIEIKDGAVRAALTQLFEAAHVQYSIDQRVSGFETLHITDQPFDTALRVLMRSSSQPLTYSVEGGVYYVTVREIPQVLLAGITSINSSESTSTLATGPRVDVLTLTYADPYDLKDLLGIKIVPTGTRAGGTGTGGGAAGAAANGAGGAKSNGGSPNVSGGGGTINAGTLISNDANNDILRIER